MKSGGKGIRLFKIMLIECKKNYEALIVLAAACARPENWPLFLEKAGGPFSSALKCDQNAQDLFLRASGHFCFKTWMICTKISSSMYHDARFGKKNAPKRAKSPPKYCNAILIKKDTKKSNSNFPRLSFDFKSIDFK